MISVTNAASTTDGRTNLPWKSTRVSQLIQADDHYAPLVDPIYGKWAQTAGVLVCVTNAETGLPQVESSGQLSRRGKVFFAAASIVTAAMCVMTIAMAATHSNLAVQLGFGLTFGLGMFAFPFGYFREKRLCQERAQSAPIVIAQITPDSVRIADDRMIPISKITRFRIARASLWSGGVGSKSYAQYCQAQFECSDGEVVVIAQAGFACVRTAIEQFAARLGLECHILKAPRAIEKRLRTPFE